MNSLFKLISFCKYFLIAFILIIQALSIVPCLLNVQNKFVERVKNEIHQRRIPSVSGGSNNVDATYNPLSINEDYFFPQTAEGRGSKVETLPGGTNLGEIDDLNTLQTNY